jgi:NTP pyrophosphatase (non-canonical NTP hydrolase)
MSIKNLSEPVRLEQLAEECAELGHAALKLSRILRAENPTPMPEETARKHLTEEIADVMVTVDSLMDTRMLRDIGTHCTEKKDRWEQRVRQAKTMRINGKEVLPG